MQHLDDNRAELLSGVAVTKWEEWSRGWLLPLASAVGYSVAVSHVYGLSQFIEPLEQEFGWTRAQLSFGITLSSLAGALSGIFVGMTVDRWGARRVALPGIIGYCTVFALLGLLTTSLWSWYILWFLIGLAAASIQAGVWLAAVATRFDRSRGLAIALTISGGGLSSMTIPILANAGIANFGWRGAFLMLAGIMAIVAIPLVILFFRDATDCRLRAGEKIRRHVEKRPIAGIVHAIRSWRFLRLCLMTFAMMGGIFAFLVHFVPMAREEGLGRGEAAVAASMIGVGSIVGRLFVGWLLDRFPAQLVGACVFVIPIAVSAALLSVAVNPVGAVGLGLVLGLSAGGEIDIIVYMTSRYFGITQLGTLYAIQAIAGMLGLAAGPYFGGWIFDSYGQYDLLHVSMILLFATVALLCLTMPRYGHGTGAKETDGQ